MSILEQDSKGRMDIAAVRVAEMFFRGPVEKMCNGLPLWDLGFGQVIEALAVEHLTSRVVTPLEVAQEMGIVKRNKPKAKRKAQSVKREPEILDAEFEDVR